MVFSVVLPTCDPRASLPDALASLVAQTLNEPFEVIIVHSGTGEVSLARTMRPAVRVIRSPTRLLPGQARNRGVEAAVGQYVAFISDDCTAVPNWLENRLMVHRLGFPLVGGSIADAYPTNRLASAEYLLEYSSLLPVASVLQRQTVPHAVSFAKSVFDRVGGYDTDVLTGEDTIFNRRCIEAGLAVGYAPEASILHRGNADLRSFLAHAARHGRGLVQCVDRYGLEASIGPMDQRPLAAASRMLLAYPLRGLVAKVRRLSRVESLWLARLARGSPLIFLGLVATGWGAWTEWSAARRRLKKLRPGGPLKGRPVRPVMDHR